MLVSAFPIHLQSQISDRESLGIGSIYALRDALYTSETPWLARWEIETVKAVLARLSLCNSYHNQFAATDLHNESDGEIFDGIGRFWYCNSKLCPTCTAKQSRRNRKRLKESLSRFTSSDAKRENKFKVKTFEDFNFITLTMPHSNIPLFRCRDIMNYAWTLFRKKTYFQKIRGGAKSEEFTFTKNGYNYHLHLLVLSKYFDYQTFRELWTDCLNKAFRKFDTSQIFNTSDELAIIKIIRIPATKKALEKMTFELSKYITKCDSWQKIPAQDLIEVALVPRFPRMFELFGDFKLATAKTILDKEEISDESQSDVEEKTPCWREIVYTHGSQFYESRLKAEFIRSKSLRVHQLSLKYPIATFHHSAELMESWENYL